MESHLEKEEERKGKEQQNLETGIKYVWVQPSTFSTSKVTTI